VMGVGLGMDVEEDWRRDEEGRRRRGRRGVAIVEGLCVEGV